MPSLADMPGLNILGAFNQARDLSMREQNAAQAGQLGQLQQVGALQGILAKARAEQQAEAYRSGLRPDMTPEQRIAHSAQFAGPEAVMRTDTAHLDRQANLKAKAAELIQAHQFKLEEIKQRSTDDATKAKELQAQNQSFQREMRQFMVDNRAPTPEQPPVAVIGPDGKNMFVNRSDAIGKQPAVKETADRVIPAPIAKAYTENSTALRKIDSALAEVDKYPAAFGLQNMRGDAISQRVDPKGVTARAIIADIGSLKIHDRSGAAVTAAETPRLLPFIPNVNDNAATIKKKLALFRAEYMAIQNDIGSMYSADQGYKALPSPQSRSTDASPVDALLEKYK